MSRLAERLDAGAFALLLEITPPKKRLEEVLVRRARLLGTAPDAINVIQRPDRMSSLDASLCLLAHDLEPIWHVANRGRSRREIASLVRSARAGGVTGALCLRGDHDGADLADTPRIRDVVAEWATLGIAGATANPYVPGPRALANLRAKLDAGARYVQTQPIFDVAHFVPFAREVARTHPGVAVIPMVMPLTSIETAERMRARLQVPIPAAHLDRLARGGEAEGWRLFAETVHGLREAGAHGLAVMTPEMDPPEPAAERIAEALRGVR